MSIETRIDRVTLYASGARVRRVTKLARPLPDRIALIGLPIAMIDDSIRVELLGGGIVRAISASVDVPSNATDREVPEVLVAARMRAEHARTEIERIESALRAAANAPVVADDPSDDPPAAWSDVIAARRALIVVRGKRELALREQHVVASRERELADEALRVAEAAEAAASTARAPKPEELRKVVAVEIESDAGTGDVELRLEYEVAGARWAPSYVARMEGDNVKVELRAVVAQASGEDWTDVAIALSTAEPARFAVLPELAAQRIGRKQDATARTGFRPPPTGARSLYADYDRAFPERPPIVIAKPPRVFTPASTREDSTFEGRLDSPDIADETDLDDGIASEVWDDEESNAKERFHTPPAGIAPVMTRGPQAPMTGRAELMRKRASTASPAPADIQQQEKQEKGRLSRGVASNNAPPPPPPPPSSTPRLDYGNLRMAPASSGDRGSLVPATRDDANANAIAIEVAARARKLADRALPPGCRAAWDHAYDYAYAAEGRVDVRADGAWTSLAIASKPGTAKLRHVAVPREQSDAFRVAAIANPFAGPLLPGPIDVYDRGQFLVSSAVEFTPPGGTVEVGLGVDPLVKIARNTEFREEAAGMLRGALKLVHAIAIDVENLGKRAIEIEIRERIPVAREGDDDVEVTMGKVEPPWEPWTPPPESPRERRLRGGRVWRVAVPPATKKTVRAGYEVKIASKHELVGGNRRER